MMVKPTANYGGRGGLKIFEFQWQRSEPKNVSVVQPLTGEVITSVPGRWVLDLRFGRLCHAFSGDSGGKWLKFSLYRICHALSGVSAGKQLSLGHVMP